MTLRKDHKVAGGKLIRLRIELDEASGLAVSVRVAGDFFAHPEEAFEEAEATLAGLGLAELPQVAAHAFARADLTIFGASAADISEALRRAIDEHQAS
jgi:hypothetical protein